MFFQAARLGAAVPASAVRLQEALVALGHKKNDPALVVTVDGNIGTQTVNATRRALITYVVGGVGSPPANWGRTLTTSTLKANANEIASYIERAAGISPEMMAAQAAGRAGARAASTASMFPAFPTPSAPAVPPGGRPMPQYYPPPTQYYPSQQPYSPGYMPAQPRGIPSAPLPTDRATLNVRAFIPAQYQDVSISPFVGIFLIVGVLAIVGMVKRHKIVEK